MKTNTLAIRVLDALKARNMTLSTAESCTGGGIGHALTEIPGSSAAYLGGVVSYTNAVKHSLLGVSRETLDHHGAVSQQTAKAMAEGVRNVIGSDLGISVTGLAGPDSDGSGKPVGLVYIGVSNGTVTLVREYLFSGDRAAVREKAVDTALELSLELINES